MKSKLLAVAAVFLVVFMVFSESVFAGSLPPVTSKRTALLICYHILNAGGGGYIFNIDIFSFNRVFADELLYLLDGPNEVINNAGLLRTRDPKRVFDYLDRYMPSEYRAEWNRGIASIRASLDAVDVDRLISGTSISAKDLRDELFYTAIVSPEPMSVLTEFYDYLIGEAVSIRDAQGLSYFGVTDVSKLSADAISGLLYMAQIKYLIGGDSGLVGKDAILKNLGAKGFSTLGTRFWAYWQTECKSLPQAQAADRFIADRMRAARELLPLVSTAEGRPLSMLNSADAGTVTGYLERAFDLMYLRNIDPVTQNLSRVNLTFDQALEFARRMVSYIPDIVKTTGLSLRNIDQLPLIMDIAVLASDFDVAGENGKDIVLNYLRDGHRSGLGASVYALTGKTANEAFGTYIGWMRTAYDILNSKYESHTLASAVQRVQELIDISVNDNRFLALMGFYINPTDTRAKIIRTDASGDINYYTSLINGFNDNDRSVYSSSAKNHMREGWASGMVSFWGSFYLMCRDKYGETTAWNMLVEQIAARMVVKEGFQYVTPSRQFSLQEGFNRDLTAQFESRLDPSNLASSAATLRGIAMGLTLERGRLSGGLTGALNSLPQREYDLMEELFGFSEPAAQYGTAPLSPALGIGLDPFNFN